MNETDILDKNYIEALEFCSNFHKEPKGITKLDSQKSSESILIRQNNFIITLLISLHKKIDSLDKTKIATSSSNIENDLKNLTSQLENFTLKPTGKEKITRKLPKEFKFPG